MGGSGSSTAAAPPPKTFMDRLLDGVEVVGNKVPHPVLMFGYLIVFIIVALVVYLIAKMFIKEAAPAGPTAEETLFTEIRDELRKRPV